MFFTSAFADTAVASSAQAPTTSQGLLSMLPMIAVLVVFMYFMVIRPQSKRSKDQKNLIDSLQSGDEVVTIGGVLGKIEKVENDFILLNIASNTNIKIQKNAVLNIVPPGTVKSE